MDKVTAELSSSSPSDKRLSVADLKAYLKGSGVAATGDKGSLWWRCKTHRTVASLKPEFDKRNTKVIGLSVDPVESHIEWEKDIKEVVGTAVNFPMIGDSDRSVADAAPSISSSASRTACAAAIPYTAWLR